MKTACLGKTMEDKRKHLDFEIVSDETRLMKCINNPSFQTSHIINENLVGVEKRKPTLKLDKPIFIGMSILSMEILLRWCILTLIVLFFILKLMTFMKTLRI